ncbi:MAG: hypothetical protein CM1200mP3_16200 [Chloroflexota bacterium]|nr:MAG: hypothetical protein CM1200mP3_16200 [Chloroflexota bacterium]
MPDLEYRRLGRTEMKPKALGLGGGYLGDPQAQMKRRSELSVEPLNWVPIFLIPLLIMVQ